MKRGLKSIKLIILIIALAVISYFLIESSVLREYISNPEELKLIILSLGILAPLAIIFLQFFQTTISIIPSQLTTILAGFLFGPILGLFYSLIGAFFGSLFIFMISRKYGKNLALKLFDKKEIVHFNHWFKQKKKWTLFLARVSPIFPNDLISFVAGLTTIKVRDFCLVSTIGFVFQMIILTYFGAELSTGKISIPLIILTIIITLLLIMVIFKSKIKKVLIKDLHKVEKVVEKEFRKI